MSLATKVKDTFSGNLHVAFRPSQTYLTATGAYNLFRIRNTAIEVLTFGARITAAAVGAEELATTFNGIAGEAAAVAINGAVGLVVYVPVNVGGTTLQAAAIPKTVVTLTTMVVGNQAANADGLVVGTFSVGTSATCEFFMVYRLLNPRGQVLVA
jgi:hypothetical protein